MRFLEQLDTTATAVVDLAERAARLRDFRSLSRRRLSADTRTSLLAAAVRLRATADRLDDVALNATATPAEIAEAVARARALGVEC